MGFNWKNTEEVYGIISRLLHWFIGFAIIGMLCLGWYMSGLDKYDPNRGFLYEFHKASGVLLLFLGCIRVLWIFFSPKPLLPNSLKHWQKNGAKYMHIALYSFGIIMPLSGYIWACADDYAFSFFGWFTVPLLFPKMEYYTSIGGNIHGALAIVFAVLVGVHIIAALKHHFIDKNTILKRML